MSSSDHDGTATDVAFERALIDSARGDDLPHAGVEPAWARLASQLAVVSAALPVGRGAGAPSAGALLQSPTVARGAAAKWFLVGALGGTLVTAGLVEWRHPRAAAPLAAERTAAPALEAQLVREPTAVRIAGPEIDEGPAQRPRPAPTRSGPRPRRQLAAIAPSTLAAEVAALDAVRRASAAGRQDEALRLLDRFQYDFPEGELAADAEVVAINALAAKGDAADATQRAQRFLARFPNDPHAADMRRIGRIP
jgi:hypothetical protein